MKEHNIKNFSEAHAIFSKYKKDKQIIFRGHSNSEWELLPKIGRANFSGANEKLIFESWKRRAIEHTKIIPQNDWEWLSIAQHHGMATRFMDWSKNPLNALFFGVDENFEADSIVYACKFNKIIKPEKHILFSDLPLTTYYPSGIVPRIVRQGGVFSYHSDPNKSINEKSKDVDLIEMIIINKSNKKLIKSELSYYGINKFTLFPDLDGLSLFINWTIEEKEYWSS